MENKKSADKTYKIFVGITAAATIGAYCIWQNMSVSLSKITYISGKVPKSFDGFKIIHISDLHNKKFIGGQNYLINKIIKASPDAIFITGDIISSYDKNIKTAIEYAKGFNSIAPTYYVTGNHETRLSAQNFDYLINALEEAGVYVLNDKALKLTKNNDSIFIAGLEDGLDPTKKAYEVLKNIDENSLKLLLMHKPNGFKQAAHAGADLIFAGHAHGGQIRLPFIGGIYAPNQGFFPKYTEGEYKHMESTMIVSRGIGNGFFPLRIFNRPQLVQITLNSKI